MKSKLLDRMKITTSTYVNKSAKHLNLLYTALCIPWITYDVHRSFLLQEYGLYLRMDLLKLVKSRKFELLSPYCCIQYVTRIFFLIMPL